jgi:formylglycine-generating enzyme required for sulfatase activity
MKRSRRFLHILVSLFLSALAGCRTLAPVDGVSEEMPGSEKSGVIQTGPFTLPGLGTVFVFAVPNPVIYWRPQPEGRKIEVEVSSSRGFEQENILFKTQTAGMSAELPLNLREGTFCFLRARRLRSFGTAEEWTPVVRISYKPLVLEMRGITNYEMAVYEMTNSLLAEIVNRLIPAGELVPEGDELKTREGVSVLGLGTLNYGYQFGLELARGDLNEYVLAPRQNREDHPAVGISWYGAAFICDSLSRMFGYRPAYTDIGPGLRADTETDGFRMPLEAEWERAARGPQAYVYPGGASARNSLTANYLRSGDPFESLGQDPTVKGGPTTPVGFYDGGEKDGYKTVNGVSPEGLCDMMGNVWEWCDDYYVERVEEAGLVPQQDGEGENPQERDPPQQGLLRVVRGAAWNTPQTDVSFQSRGWYKAGGYTYSLGLRLARTRK